MTDGRLGDVFRMVGDVTGLQVTAWDPRILDLAVSYSAENTTLDSILIDLLVDRGIAFEVVPGHRSMVVRLAGCLKH